MNLAWSLNVNILPEAASVVGVLSDCCEVEVAEVCWYDFMLPEHVNFVPALTGCADVKLIKCSEYENLNSFKVSVQSVLH